MRRIFITLVACLMCVINADAREYSIKSYKLSGLSPKSMSEAEGSFDFTIDNHGQEMRFKNASGKIFHKNVSLGSFTVNDFSVPAHATTTVTVSGRLELTEGRNWMNLLTVVPGFDLDDFTVNFACDASYKGVNRRFDLNGLNVGGFVHRQ